MSAQLSDLAAFIDRWRGPLAEHAKVAFHFEPREEDFAAHHVTADTFVAGLGYQPIGFAWEMLDAALDATGPRSAVDVMAKALTRDETRPQVNWLGDQRARECAEQFASAFDPAHRTILSNHYDGLWHPIASKGLEWAFVGYDDRKIALLLVTAED